LTGGVTYAFKIDARNSVGYSQISLPSSILCARVPDAPSSLADDTSLTTDLQIGITWAEPFNGGSEILDYQISYDQGLATNEYVVLASGIRAHSYLATSLTAGLTYKFKVEARNVVGLSAYSNIVGILAAKPPNTPYNL